MGSKRLPGKSLALIGQKPLLVHTIEAIASRFEKSQMIIATSKDSDCDSIESLGRDVNISVYRGDEKNVASRFSEIIKERRPSYFCRISGDSPFIDAQTIVKAFDVIEDKKVDLVSTTGLGFPSGMNVEVLRSDFFIENYPKFNSSAHFEHVTKFFYEKAHDFKIQYLECPVRNARDYKFSVDTPEDRERMNFFFSKLEKEPFRYSLEEKCDLFSSLFKGAPC